jgi:septum formation protein
VSTPTRFVLASASTSRLRVLHDAGFDPEVIVSGVDEHVEDLTTTEAVATLARRKAEAVAPGVPGALVLGCDSLLDVAGEPTGKPPTPQDAERLWQRIAGSTAVLCTGHCLVDTRSGGSQAQVVATRITFGTPSPAELRAYVATGEPLTSAGGFTTEGFGAPFVAGIEGDPSNVLGLSMPMLRTLLGNIGIAITDLWRSRP